MVDVDGDRVVRESCAGNDLDALVLLELPEIGRLKPLDQFKSAAQQVCGSYCCIGHRLEHDLVEVDATSIPVLVEAPQRDLVLRHALDKAERPCADRLIGDVLSGASERLRRQHHAGAIGKHAYQRRTRLGQFDPNSHWINYGHISDRLYLTLAP